MTDVDNAHIKKHDQTLDLIRSFALVVIVIFHHLPSKLFNFYDLRQFGVEMDISFLGHLSRYYGLGLFVFLSGYLMASRYCGKIQNLKEISVFLKRRFFRIYPLYWLALLLYLAVFYYYPRKAISSSNLISHFAGLQLFYGKPVPTLWYVGLITVYYSLFVLMEYFGRKKHLAFIYSVVILLGLIVMKMMFKMVDNRLIIYWPVFVFGIEFFQKKPSVKLVNVIVMSSITVIGSTCYLKYLMPPDLVPMSTSFLLTAALLIIVMVGFVVSVFYVCQNLSIPLITNFTDHLAYSSYCIYLFHSPTFTVIHFVIKEYPGRALRCVIFSGVIVSLFLVSYTAQRVSDRVVLFWSHK